MALPWLWMLLSVCSRKSCSALPIGVRAAGLLPKGLLRGEYGNSQLLACLTFSLSLCSNSHTVSAAAYFEDDQMCLLRWPMWHGMQGDRPVIRHLAAAVWSALSQWTKKRKAER